MRISETMVPEGEQELDPVDLSKRDAIGFIPHEDDPIVIKIQIRHWTVKRILVDRGSFADILYWEALRGMEFDIAELDAARRQILSRLDT